VESFDAKNFYFPTRGRVYSHKFLAVFAQDFQKGKTAYKTNNYTVAYNEWQPLAEQGHAAAQYNPAQFYDIEGGTIVDFDEAQNDTVWPGYRDTVTFKVALEYFSNWAKACLKIGCTQICGTMLPRKMAMLVLPSGEKIFEKRLSAVRWQSRLKK
jgi:hypothetical protein|tara:strand:- start:311 stop:775 length:465 start_codon:yes stop_codon:yes gene_type:complete